MILQEFPDLLWLKQQIDQRFQQRRGYHNMPLETDGFPNVIIHTTTKKVYRPDILGPISLFLNLQGESHCKVDGRTVTVKPDYFFLSNRLQEYTLTIDSTSPVETFNIHIGEAFSEGILTALLTPADVALANGMAQQSKSISFHNQLYRKDAVFDVLIHRLKNCMQQGLFVKEQFEENMEQLLCYLLRQHRQVMEQLNKMPQVKRSTQVEIYKRLSYALDLIHSSANDIDVAALAAAACLSKYHFLRLFKQTYRCSPYQYWQSLRLEKAKKLLLQPRRTVQSIADELGFENSNSFTRLFLQRMQLSPSQYRNEAK